MKFNIFDLIAFIFNCAVAYVAGRYCGLKWGIAGWILGSCLGFGLGLLAIVLPAYIWTKIRPLRPICGTGICKANNYRLLRVTKDGSIFQCKCGNKYLRLRTEKRFLEILPDGMLRSYQKRTRFGQWEQDSAPPPQLKITE